MRARYPDTDGFVDRDGVKIYYELYENDGPTVLLMPTWSLFHSRHWKMQIPYLSRHFRVLTFDGRGNGKSDHVKDPRLHNVSEYLADAIAVMDATATDQAVVVGLSFGGYLTAHFAAQHPDRTIAIVALGAATGLGDLYPELVLPERAVYPWDEPLDTTEGWAKYNRFHWLEDYPDFVEFFVSNIISEPHSTKPIEDGIRWALDSDGEMLVSTGDEGSEGPAGEEAEAAYRSISCPVLIIHGEDDHVISHAAAVKLAELTGGRLISIADGGHYPQGRDPAKVNHLIKGFIDRITNTPPPSQIWSRGLTRRKRALYVSSPIGLGHAQRDVSIAQELQRSHPDLEIDWLAQHPVTKVLEAAGEKIHPASEYMANESGHIESESGEHDLHCFQALRRMDEILLANFMVFQEVVDEGLYDLVIGDESWEVDYYWHENPELKRCPHVWLTDFVGFIPMPSGGDHEAFLTTDYNAEMIEHIARYPWIRDRAIFVGTPDDIVPHSFGGDLPLIRDWTEENFDFSGYITGFEPPSVDEIPAIRDELGYRPDEKVCIVTVGGSGVGRDLLERIISSYPEAKQQVPELRMIVVAGPRIDPDSLPKQEGLEVRSYVDRLYRHLGVCDIALVQGGLTTTMELTAGGRPFLYFPLRDHFEQNFHVRHRLNRYGAGRYMDFAVSNPDAISAAMTEELDRNVTYQAVETDGAARAAAMISELL
jgi:pimeloyl-ACP methyl ester carboxylesterase/predicted glycosyltransferase